MAYEEVDSLRPSELPFHILTGNGTINIEALQKLNNTPPRNYHYAVTEWEDTGPRVQVYKLIE